MHYLTLLYPFYVVKICTQLAIYIISLARPLSDSIQFIAIVVVLLAFIPVIHLVIHSLAQKPLSDLAIVAYTCFSVPLAGLWFKPVKDCDKIVSFVLVSLADAFTLIFFIAIRMRDQGNAQEDAEALKSNYPQHVQTQPFLGGDKAPDPLGNKHPATRTESGARPLEMQQVKREPLSAASRTNVVPGGRSWPAQLSDDYSSTRTNRPKHTVYQSRASAPTSVTEPSGLAARLRAAEKRRHSRETSQQSKPLPKTVDPLSQQSRFDYDTDISVSPMDQHASADFAISTGGF